MKRTWKCKLGLHTWSGWSETFQSPIWGGPKVRIEECFCRQCGLRDIRPAGGW